MRNKIIVFILCICLISTFCLQPAYAMGAEGVIVGGGAGASIGLSMPQVALLIAAGYGLVFAVQHGDEISQMLNEGLTNAANNVENGMEQLTAWKEAAIAGFVSLTSAPPWIQTEVKEWVNELYTLKEVIDYTCVDYKANEAIPAVDFWSTTNTYSFPVDVNVLRVGKVAIFGNYATGYWSILTRMVVVSLTAFEGCETYYKSPTEIYYYKGYTFSANPLISAVDRYLQDGINAIQEIPLSTEIYNLYPNLDSNGAVIQAWLDGLLIGNNDSVRPDTTVGGIYDVIGSHGLDNIKVPDLDIGGSKLLNPGNTADGSIDDVLDNTLTGLKQQEINWRKFMDDVAVGVPTVSIPATGEMTKPLEYPITDTGVSDIPIDTTIPGNPAIPGNPTVEIPEGLEPFTISLSDLFPFCIPFDIAEFVNVLCAEPQAPSFEWAFPTLDGTTYKMEIDLSPFDSVAQLLRNMEILLFCIGLALMTRNQIRG